MNIKVPGDGNMMESMDPDDEASEDEALTGRRHESSKDVANPCHAVGGSSPPNLPHSGSMKQPQMDLQHGPGSFDAGSNASTAMHLIGGTSSGAFPSERAAAAMAASAATAAAASRDAQPHPSTSGLTKCNSLTTSTSTLNRKQLEEALLFQMELQKKLHEQLEVRNRMRSSIEMLVTCTFDLL